MAVATMSKGKKKFERKEIPNNNAERRWKLQKSLKL